jgi:hypothetical protein
MTTRLQTVEIIMPGSTNVVLSLERYPICPVCVVVTDTVYLDAPNGDVYTWYWNGDASVLSKDGTYRYFWSKPTLKATIYNMYGQYHGNYTRFFTNGSVENKFDNKCYWWGPTVNGEPVEGTTYELCQKCNGKNCYETCIEDADSCGLCGRVAWTWPRRYDCECRYYQ